MVQESSRTLPGRKQLGQSVAKLGPGTSASGAGGEGSRWSCSFMAPAPWDLTMAIPWDQHWGRVTGKGGQGQHCSLGLSLSPCWNRIRIWKGCGAPALLRAWCSWELQCRCFTALGQIWHLLLLLPVELHGSSSSPAPARHPSCSLPAALLWLSARGTGISALPFPGMGWETQYVPWPGHSDDILGFEMLQLRSWPLSLGFGPLKLEFGILRLGVGILEL